MLIRYNSAQNALFIVSGCEKSAIQVEFGGF